MIGPVIDIEFPAGLPEIYNAVRVVSDGAGGTEKVDVVAEVEQHLGENRVRAVAMKPTVPHQRMLRCPKAKSGRRAASTAGKGRITLPPASARTNR